MHADDTLFSIPAVWEPFYRELCGTLWEGEDIENVVYRKNHDAIAAANALRHVYRLEWKGVEAEDGVRATLKAAQEHHRRGFLTPRQVKEMAANFVVRYRDRVEPMDDYLEEFCGEVRWHWLNQHGQHEIQGAVVKDSDIWIQDVKVSNDVWVFNRPGHGT